MNIWEESKISEIEKLVIDYYYITEEYDISIGCKYVNEYNCHMPITGHQRRLSTQYASSLWKSVLWEAKRCNYDLEELNKVRINYSRYGYEQIKELYEKYVD